ncbi:MAG: DNA replication/repair protein RecF [Leptospiraceae bacterium]|nr:DNA replication/repair protein RecF [Leptospiraceae bacterium]
MRKLQLQHYRNYAHLELQFPDRLTFLVGENGSGKTNVLEAISILSQGKSFRGAPDPELVQQGQSSFYLSCQYEWDGAEHSLEMGVQLEGRLQRRIKKDGKVLASRSALIGNLVSVVFSPDDLEIVQGGPTSRRRFLDALLSHRDPAYLQNLLQYNRLIRQRNATLKSIRTNRARLSDLDAWDSMLVNLGTEITRKRRQFLQEYEPILNQSIDQISGGKDRIKVSLFPGEARPEDFKRALMDRRMRDVATGASSFGPHRDRLLFICQDGSERDIQFRFSQGQKRSLVLALRVGQFYYLKQYLGRSPILLIDDVIRELDYKRRDYFVDLLHRCGQAFFTTPDLDGLQEAVETTGARIIQVPTLQRNA